MTCVPIVSLGRRAGKAGAEVIVESSACYSSDRYIAMATFGKISIHANTDEGSWLAHDLEIRAAAGVGIIFQ